MKIMPWCTSCDTAVMIVVSCPPPCMRKPACVQCETTSFYLTDSACTHDRRCLLQLTLPDVSHLGCSGHHHGGRLACRVQELLHLCAGRAKARGEGEHERVRLYQLLSGDDWVVFGLCRRRHLLQHHFRQRLWNLQGRTTLVCDAMMASAGAHDCISSVVDVQSSAEECGCLVETSLSRHPEWVSAPTYGQQVLIPPTSCPVCMFAFATTPAVRRWAPNSWCCYSTFAVRRNGLHTVQHTPASTSRERQPRSRPRPWCEPLSPRGRTSNNIQCRFWPAPASSPAQSWRQLRRRCPLQLAQRAWPGPRSSVPVQASTLPACYFQHRPSFLICSNTLPCLSATRTLIPNRRAVRLANATTEAMKSFGQTRVSHHKLRLCAVK
jgi:hypothetical protein